jgi:hypothetical protein
MGTLAQEGLTERLDDLGVFELIHFGHDTCRLSHATVFHLSRDQRQQAPTHGRGRDQQRIA